MPDLSWQARIQETLQDASNRSEEYASWFDQGKAYIVDNFGSNGLTAAYIAAGVIVLVILSRLTRITFATLKFLVVPALALAFIGSFFLPYSFIAMLPVTVTACSLFLLVKG
ncbi:MAG: hypothetical protein ACE5FH_05690 [Candidatus Zixiibacteriota bacterium]